ncbi:protein transport protein Sec31A isoform X2 [Homalodisca vitripennis]|uniref:protein transport protein Sec31A isoform X2 n=1 Tax=Homalodisca vitripennis TaxID=197043 RepID=UPI001EEB6C81|nr:protein transport protein Sec31A isoform X2 [Homalodisca vitripennis]
MKVKELDKTVNLAWSPAYQVPVMLAAGTAAQQLDASFSTSAALEIYDINLSEPGLDMELKSSIQSQNRFHKLVWGATGAGGNGVIVGGCDNGRLQMYNASRVLAGDDGLLCAPERHTGHVKAVDFNPFQTNLLSTGASESEIFIWDLNNVKTPMTPGAKSQPAEEVVWLAWNKQVQHILASAFSTRCVVWDLRKNEPIIKLSDSNSRVRWKVVAWHPDVATQLCLASEEDSNPVIQLWDLRFATTPIKTMEGHHKGVLSIAWCAQDPELLVSCGKDSRILFWNPNSSQSGGEMVCEMETSNQWNFEVNWCPRNPSLVATSSFDGHASVFSLVGGQQQMQTSNKIADSFPGMEQYAEAPVVQPPQHAPLAVELRKAPKWLKRPSGASFGFGGKLVTFSSDSQAVSVSQVVTEPSLVERSQRLQQLLASGQLREVCHSKSDPVWTFVAASLEPDSRLAMRTLLGFTQDQLELDKYIGQPVNAKLGDIDGLAEDFSVLSQAGSFSVVQNNSHEFNSLRSEKSSIDNNKSPFKIKIGEDKEGVICRALLAGNLELAVDLCVQESRMTDAIILAQIAGPDVLARTQYKYFQQNQSYLSHLLSAVVTKDWNQVVSCCDLSSWAEALAAILTYASDHQLPSLCERLGDRLEREGGMDSRRNSEICFVAAGQLGHLIQNRIASDLSTEALQELVELVLVAKRGDVQDNGTAYLLDRYAKLLASQGDFNTALAYLTSSQQEDIEELRERLYVASGQKPYPASHVQQNVQYKNTMQTGHYGKAVKQQQQPPSYHQPPLSSSAFPNSAPAPTYSMPAATPSRKPSISNPLVSSFQSSAPANFASPMSNFPPPNTPPSFPTSQPLFPPQPQPSFPTGPPANFTPVSSAFAPPLPSQKSYQPSSLPPPPPVSRTPVHFNSETVPPPPSVTPSAFSHRGNPSPSLGGSARKYVVDPSVGGGSSFRSPSNTQFNSNPYVPQSAPLPYNAMPPQPQSFAQPAYNNLPPQPQQQSYNSLPPQPQPQMYNNMAPQSQVFNPPSSLPPITSQPEHFPPQQFVPKATAAPGWNDPPALSGSARTQIKDVQQPPPPPITHPLFAVPSQEMPLQGVPPISVQQGVGGEGESHPGYNFPTHQVMPPTQAAPPPAPPVAKAVEPPRPKPPLPEEHMYLQTVFDELCNKCICAANNPQLKRKLEDVARKLEVLYDGLRENKFSGTTLTSLHQLVQLVQRGDYMNALQLHTQLISGHDFSQICAFMPGLKVLIQLALQLGVYLQ